MNNTYVVVGASAAGISVVTHLLRLCPQSQVICITKETEFPYNKCLLANYCARTINRQSLYLKPVSFFNNPRLEFILGQEVVAINRADRNVMLSNGRTIGYSKLFLGLGTEPQKIRIAESIALHTLQDLDYLVSKVESQPDAHVLVVGGGFSGIETAFALKKRNLQVTLLEREDSLVPSIRDWSIGEHVANFLAKEGITVLCGQTILSVNTLSPKVYEVETIAGIRLKTYAIVNTTGVAPATSLAERAGLSLEDKRLNVDAQLRTNDPTVFAGGDCAMVQNRMQEGLIASTQWMDAVIQGSIAATTMIGGSMVYPGIIPTATAYLGNTLVSWGGVLHQSPNEYERIVETSGKYQRLFYTASGTLHGYSIMGRASEVLECKKLLYKDLL